MAHHKTSLALLLLVATSALAAPADVVIAFNNEAQQAVRENGIPNQLSGKIYALVHHSIYKAISGNDPALHNAQAAYAGHSALGLLFPWRWQKQGKVLAGFVANLTDAQKVAGERAGRAAANQVVSASLKDGFDRYVPYTPAPAGGPVGKYQFVTNQTYSLYPQIATTTPLLLQSNSYKQFYPPPPPKIPSPEYTQLLAEVFRVGRKESTERTQEQTDAARFWADGNTTSSVAGHFNTLAQLLVPASYTTKQAALLFAHLNVAIWDASIVAYKAKYEFSFWRPVTAIRQGDGSKENAAYVDAEWSPLLNTPAHPEYPSGHSATVGAAGGVLINTFGNDKTFTVGTEFPGLPPRTYKTIKAAVDDVNWSRVWAGVHFRTAVSEGALTGRKVANFVFQRYK